MAPQLVMVGAGMATAFLLEELSRRDHPYSITVAGEESRACYNRVLLSGLLAGEVVESDLELLPEQCDAEFVTGVRVTEMDLERRSLACDNGRSLDYDALVIATGASVATPDIGVREADNLLVVRTVDDVERLRAMTGGGRALVIGGGLLGLEAAHGLNALGFDTTVLHRNPVLMNRQLDAEGGACLQAMLEEHGLAVRTGASPAAVVYDDAGAVTGVALDSGDTLSCDLLVVATGIVPQAELATQGELDTDRGILVDGHLRTSRDGVYALGECCQIGDETFGLVAPVREQAAVLAATLCGEDVPAFDGSNWSVQLKISGIDIFRAGDLDGSAEQVVLRDAANGVYRRLAIRDDRLVGALLVGDRRGSTWYADLINQQDDISALRGGLMFGPEVAGALADAASALGERL